MRPQTNFGWGVVSGLVFFLIIGIVALSYIDSNNDLAIFVLNYQSLIGSIVTLIAAFIGGFFIYSQTKEQTNTSNKIRQSKLISARAELSFALASLNDYARVSIFITKHIFDKSDYKSIIRKGESEYEVPTLNNSVFTSIRNFLEYADENERRAFLIFLPTLQIQNSRLTEFIRYLNDKDALGSDLHHVSSTIFTKLNVASYLIDAIEIHARVSMAYDYARFFDRCISEDDFPKYLQNSYTSLRLDDLKDGYLNKIFNSRLVNGGLIRSKMDL